MNSEQGKPFSKRLAELEAKHAAATPGPSCIDRLMQALADQSREHAELEWRHELCARWNKMAAHFAAGSEYIDDPERVLSALQQREQMRGQMEEVKREKESREHGAEVARLVAALEIAAEQITNHPEGHSAMFRNAEAVIRNALTGSDAALQEALRVARAEGAADLLESQAVEIEARESDDPQDPWAAVGLAIAKRKRDEAAKLRAEAKGGSTP